MHNERRELDNWNEIVGVMNTLRSVKLSKNDHVFITHNSLSLVGRMFGLAPEYFILFTDEDGNEEMVHEAFSTYTIARYWLSLTHQ